MIHNEKNNTDEEKLSSWKIEHKPWRGLKHVKLNKASTTMKKNTECIVITFRLMIFVFIETELAIFWVNLQYKSFILFFVYTLNFYFVKISKID